MEGGQPTVIANTEGARTMKGDFGEKWGGAVFKQITVHADFTNKKAFVGGSQMSSES